MRRNWLWLAWVLSWNNLSYSQGVIPQQVLQNLPEVEELAVDEERNILLADVDEGRIYKYLAASNYDSSYHMGGAGIRLGSTGSYGEAFDRPLHLRVPNRSEIFLLDYGNRRIVLLNTNLRVVREHEFLETPLKLPDTDEQVYIYPESFEIGQAGELFVLSQDDNRIYKFDSYGRFESVFGGLEYGQGSLFNPSDIALAPDNTLFVPDTQRQSVTIFDNFGTYQTTLQPSLAFHWTQLRARRGQLIFMGVKQLAVLSLDTQLVQYLALPATPALPQDVEAKPWGIYVLLANKIYLYTL